MTLLPLFVFVFVMVGQSALGNEKKLDKWGLQLEPTTTRTMQLVGPAVERHAWRF
jgi:hypothetical protein